MLAYIRKALNAALTAGIGAAASTIGQAALDGTLDRADVGNAIGFGIAAALVAGYSTYQIRNAPRPRR